MEPAFKTLRLRREWKLLKDKNTRFYLLLLQIFNHTWPTVPIITNLYRYKSEQNRIYSKSTRYRKKPWNSVHQYWRGCDVTLHNLEEQELLDLEKKVNIAFSYGKGAIRTMIAHDVGRGNHIHLQMRAQ